MKRILVLFIGMYACCWSTQAQLKVGIHASADFTSASGSVLDSWKDQKYSMDSYTGYSAGLLLDIPVWKGISVQPQLNFAMKGIKASYEKTTTRQTTRLDLKTYKRYSVSETKGTTKKTTIDAGYIELPVLFTYRYNLSKNIGIQGGLGPYFAYGIVGNVTAESKTFTYVSPDKYKESGIKSQSQEYGTFGKSEGQDPKGGLERFGAGLKIQAAIHWKKVFLQIGYSVSLKNAIISEDDYNKDKDLKLKTFSVGLGYTF